MNIDVTACCVCHSIKRRGEWYNVGEPIYNYIMTHKEKDKETGLEYLAYNFSHGYCKKCAEPIYESIRRQKERRLEEVVNNEKV